MFARPSTRLRAVPVIALTAVTCAVTMILRYNAPEGSLGGLTDDHFYFVTLGWQMLFGELPDRDYFEPGAPLTLAISAALQTLLGRSIWSEYVFCVAVLAVGSAITFVLAARSSGSILLGLGAFLFQFALLPRLYGYPKIVIYAAAIGALWAWAASPGTRRTWVVAVITAVAFLLRHDHGIFVGFGFLVVLLSIGNMPVGQRAKQALIYAVTLVALLTPYLAYLQFNGGIERHFVTTYAWSERDYGRSPRVLPTFERRDVFQDAETDAPASEWWEHAPFAGLSEYSTFWLFWFFMALPVVALLVLLMNPAHGPPDWSQERAKMLAVIAIAAVVDWRFLRGNLAGRLADVSVPMSILAAWVLAKVGAVVLRGRVEIAGRQRPVGGVTRGAIGVVTGVLVLVTALVLVRPFVGALENARATEGLESMRSGAALVTNRLQHTWPLASDESASRTDFALARYLQACTAPTDRVLITEFHPQIAGLAQRGFAAGHVDLRGGGFFGTVSEQELTVQRWQRQSVPLVLGPTSRDYPDWAENLPLVARYLNGAYRNLGEKNVGGFTFLLFERRDARVVRTYAPLGFPCFR